MERYLYCPRCHGQFQDYEECPYCHVHLLKKRDVDRPIGHRLLQAISVPVAALMAVSNIALLVGFAVEVFYHQDGGRGVREGGSSAFLTFWVVIGCMIIAAFAVLVALPLRFYAGGAVRGLAILCAGCLIVGALALAGILWFSWVLIEGLGGSAPTSLAAWVIVAVLSALGSAMVLLVKSHVGWQEAI